MKKMKKMTKIFLAVMLLVFCASSAFALQKGGVMRYATIAEPPTLDQHIGTSDLTTMIAQHMFEGLYTFNSKYEPVPMLVESETMTPDNLSVTLKLREGVKFHNGKELTADDVVASLKRWGEFGTRGPVLFNNIASIDGDGKYSVAIKFKAPFAAWKNLLAFINGGPVIYPAELVSAAGKTPLTPDNYIGTGPYKFAEINPGRYVKLVRFDDYVERKEPGDGYAGERVAYFDELRFIPVPDAGTRINGVKAGDYDYAEQIPGDLFDTFANDETAKTIVNQGALQGFMFMNSKEGVLKGNFKLRQALLAATNMKDVLRVAIGAEELWKANASFMPQNTSWYSEAATDKYSRSDAAAAKKLAEEAGYKGEKIVFMASSSYKMHQDSCMVIAKQLKDAGFNIDLQIYDWATLASKRSDPMQWDIFFTHHGFVPDPMLFTFMSESYAGWWTTETKRALASEFSVTVDPVARKAVWDKIQTLVYEEVPVIKTGDAYPYDIHSPKIKGLSETSLIWPKMWGISF